MISVSGDNMHALLVKSDIVDVTLARSDAKQMRFFSSFQVLEGSKESLEEVTKLTRLV